MACARSRRAARRRRLTFLALPRLASPHPLPLFFPAHRLWHVARPKRWPHAPDPHHGRGRERNARERAREGSVRASERASSCACARASPQPPRPLPATPRRSRWARRAPLVSLTSARARPTWTSRRPRRVERAPSTYRLARSLERSHFRSRVRSRPRVLARSDVRGRARSAHPRPLLCSSPHPLSPRLASPRPQVSETLAGACARLDLPKPVLERARQHFASFRDARQNVTALGETTAACLVAAFEE